MKYLTFLAASVVMFTLMACGHGRPVDESETTGTTQPATPANTTLQPQTTPVTLNSNTSPASPLTVSPSTTATAPGMNPAHGEPGHRCDIAVGAPLNSAPTQPTTPAVTTPVTTPLNISADKLTPPATATKVAPGMNPAHGEPGHRCDIAVGAPLNSKPTVVTGTPSTNTVSSSQSIPSVVPIKPVLDPKKDNR